MMLLHGSSEPVAGRHLCLNATVGIAVCMTVGIRCRTDRYALFYKNRGPNQSNWLHHTAAPFHSEEYKLPELGSAELAYLRQTLAGKLARKASEPKPQPATADLTNTTNWAATYASSGSARTDLFFKVKEPGAYLPASTEDTTTQLLQQVSSRLQTLTLCASATCATIALDTGLHEPSQYCLLTVSL